MTRTVRLEVDVDIRPAVAGDLPALATWSGQVEHVFRPALDASDRVALVALARGRFPIGHALVDLHGIISHSDDERLGYAVEHGPEDDRQPSSSRLAAFRPLAVLSPFRSIRKSRSLFSWLEVTASSCMRPRGDSCWWGAVGRHGFGPPEVGSCRAAGDSETNVLRQH
jgi:hypothetical protein